MATTCAWITRAVSSMLWPSTTCMLIGVAVMMKIITPCPTTPASTARAKAG